MATKVAASVAAQAAANAVSNAVRPRGKQGCCQATVCGKKVNSWDYLCFAGEAGTGTGGGVYLAAGSWVTGGGFLLLGGAIVWLHWKIRKDISLEDVNQVDQDFKETDKSLIVTVDKTDEIARRVQEQTQALSTELATTKAEVATVRSENQQLKQTVTRLGLEKQQFQETSEALQKTNDHLVEQLHAMDAAMKRFQTFLAKYNQQNTTFKQSLGQMDSDTTAIAHDQKEFESEFGDLEHHLDSNVSALAAQMKQAQATSQDIARMYTSQRENLERQIVLLSSQVAAEAQLDKSLGTKKQQLEAVMAEEKEALERVAKLQAEMQDLRATVDRLKLEREALAKTELAIHSDAAGIADSDRSLSRTADRLTDLERRFADDVSGLQKVDASLAGHANAEGAKS